MGSAAAPRRHAATLGPVAVGPSRIVKFVVRPMTKILNPPIGKLAGRRHFPMPPSTTPDGTRAHTM